MPLPHCVVLRIVMMIIIERIVRVACVCCTTVFMKAQIVAFLVEYVKDQIIVWQDGMILLRINMQLHVSLF